LFVVSSGDKDKEATSEC